MITRFRAAIGLAILAPVLLCACSPASPASNVAASASRPVPAPVLLTEPAKPRLFTLNTPVDRIAADPQGKAVLERDVPGLMKNKDYPMFDDMSLSEIALISGGRLTKSKLDLVKSDLIQISYLAPGCATPPLVQPAQ